VFFLNFGKSGRGSPAHWQIAGIFQCFQVVSSLREIQEIHSWLFLRFVDCRIQAKINNFDEPFCNFSLLNVLQKIHVYRYQSSVSIRGAFPENIFRIAPPYPHHRHPGAGNRLNLLQFFWIRIYESEQEKSNTCLNICFSLKFGLGTIESR